jgi:serine/threonine protein kinase
MALTPGTRIGGYEIASHAGSGGMGEVYRARDTQLQRDVAIKVLPELFARDPERLARFEREAQMLASLNHPNIAQIYAVEAGFIVMEFVDGEDLAQRMTRGAVPLDDALAIARQIADALDAAHERGIIHRDLKPANVRVTAGGVVKVLDFGLAKAITNAADSAIQTLPTITSPAMTNLGVIMGTAAYMSPEQARGKPVDRRADIWALGVVLFEMLSGTRPYTGETVTDTIARVITQPPAWDLLPSGLAAPVRRILRRCLEKDPRMRFQSAGDVRLEIDEFLASPSLETAPPPATVEARRSPWPWAAAAALAAMLIAALALWRPLTSTPPASPIRFDVRVTETERIVIDDNSDGAMTVISPDGRTLVYAGLSGTTRRLYARRLDSSEAKPLSGSDNARSPFFSPDSAWVGFFVDGLLKKVSLAGGGAVTICPAPDSRGGTWGADDTIVFTPVFTTGLSRVAAAGGTPVELTKLGSGERTHRWPSFLPDGKAVLFIRQNGDASYDDGVIEAVSIADGRRKVLMNGGTFPHYLRSGHLAYIRESTLYVVPFDASRLEVTGAARPVLSGVMSSGGIGGGAGDGASQISFSSTGTAVYLPGGSSTGGGRLVVVDRTGKTLYTHPERRDFRSPRFSPDGTRIAVQIGDGKLDQVYVVDPERGTTTKVTFDTTAGGNGTPAWSPDGKQLAFVTQRGSEGMNIAITRSDGAGEPEMLTTGPGITVPGSFSPDGARLAVMRQDGAVMKLFVMGLADRRLVPFGSRTGEEGLPMFSPDGKWIAYQLLEGGIPEVFVRPYPGPGGKWQISSGGGLMPHWGKAGRELTYIQLPNRIMAVPIEANGDALQPGKPEMLFEIPIEHNANSSWMDESADGKRFVVLRAEDETRARGITHVTFVLNFFEEIRRRPSAPR